MANYDGPLYVMSAPAIFPGQFPERDNLEPVFWPEDQGGEFIPVSWLGSGGSGGGGGVENGYGYGHSG